MTDYLTLQLVEGRLQEVDQLLVLEWKLPAEGELGACVLIIQ